MYPTELKITGNIGKGGTALKEGRNILLDGDRAITLEINIMRADYPEEDVKNAVKEICEKVAGYYC